VGASVLNTVSITVFNSIYQIVAVKLTDSENHRTDTLYEDSLSVKLFVFQFINSYSSFFFIAFVAQHLPKPSGTDASFHGACGAATCMEPLMLNLAIIFGTRLTVTNIVNLLVPVINSIRRERAEKAHVKKGLELSEAGKQYVLITYDPVLENINNYADTAVQYGFMMLFIPALPCATFLSMLNNYAKIKFDSWKLFTLYQRPNPIGTQDIGSWQGILTIISVISVITNAGLISFTMNTLDGYSTFARMATFIGIQWALVFIQVVFGFYIPDVPEEVRIQGLRNDFIESKIIQKISDDDEYKLLMATHLDDLEKESKVAAIETDGLLKTLKSTEHLIDGKD
jgi:hypothetical protein